MILKEKTAKVETRTGSGYSYTYADLEECVTKTQPILAEHGLAVIQPLETTENGDVLNTRLMHISGEWLEATKTLPYADNAPPQSQGGVITYFRRYTYCTLLRIVADEDNDAAHAEPAPKRRAAPTPQPVAQAQPEPEVRTLTAEEHEVQAKRSAARTALAQLKEDGIVTSERANELWGLYGKEDEERWFKLLQMELARHAHEHPSQEEFNDDREPEMAQPANVTNLAERAAQVQQTQRCTRPAPGSDGGA